MNRSRIIITILSVALLLAGGIIYELVKSNPFLMSKIYPPKPPPSPFSVFGPDCETAPVNPDDLFVAVAVNRGDTLANLQLNDPTGRTTIVRVVIEKGSKPITVLLQADDAVIWDFEGEVGRVARAIVVPAYRDRGAVRGLSEKKVDFLKLARCPTQRMPLGNVVHKNADGIFHGYFGRVPQVTAFHEAPNSVSIPAVTFGFPPKEGSTRTAETKAERDLLFYYPGGFRMVDAKSVIARGDVLEPETYPGEAGLIQLERAGAIRPATQADNDAFSEGVSKPYRSRLSPDFRMGTGFSYVVLRDVMLPAGLHGGHLKNILVASGVPAPRGGVGHGCLAFMDGFKTTDDGPSCFGSEGADGLRQLAKLPDPVVAEQCRVFAVAPTSSIEAVSMYRPKSATSSFNSARNPEPVGVSVTKPGDIVLVLNTYEPAIWKVSVTEGTRITGVILTGYYTSRVEGIASDTPVLALELRSRKNAPKPDDVCAPFSNYLGTAFRGGPAALVLDRQIAAVTGRNVDGLRGDYALDRVEIK